MSAGESCKRRQVLWAGCVVLSQIQGKALILDVMVAGGGVSGGYLGLDAVTRVEPRNGISALEEEPGELALSVHPVRTPQGGSQEEGPH